MGSVRDGFTGRFEPLLQSLLAVLDHEGAIGLCDRKHLTDAEKTAAPPTELQTGTERVRLSCLRDAPATPDLLAELPLHPPADPHAAPHPNTPTGSGCCYDPLNPRTRGNSECIESVRHNSGCASSNDCVYLCQSSFQSHWESLLIFCQDAIREALQYD
jgi:hypothetical protein